MKKSICTVLVLLIVFSFTMIAFADTASNPVPLSYYAGYTTPVKKYFNTTSSWNKASEARWQILQDHNAETIIVNMTTGGTYNYSHKTWVVKSNGAILLDDPIIVPNGATRQFSAAVISAAETYNTLKLRVYNMKYPDTNLRMKTTGQGEATLFYVA